MSIDEPERAIRQLPETERRILMRRLSRSQEIFPERDGAGVPAPYDLAAQLISDSDGPEDLSSNKRHLDDLGETASR